MRERDGGKKEEREREGSISPLLVHSLNNHKLFQIHNINLVKTATGIVQIGFVLNPRKLMKVTYSMNRNFVS